MEPTNDKTNIENNTNQGGFQNFGGTINGNINITNNFGTNPTDQKSADLAPRFRVPMVFFVFLLIASLVSGTLYIYFSQSGLDTDTDTEPVPTDVAVHVKYLESNPDLSNKVDAALSKLFTRLHSAYGSNTLDLNGLDISNSAKSQIINLWKNARFQMAGLFCSTAAAAKLGNSSDYVVFGIPIKEKGDNNLQEYFIQFNNSGQIVTVEKNPFPIVDFNFGKKEVSNEVKQTLTLLLYELRDAYNKPDWKYLERVYDKNGLCIVGQRDPGLSLSYAPDYVFVVNEQKYTFIIRRMGEYLKKLKLVFASGHHYHFDYGVPTITAHKNPNPKFQNVYYVQVKQTFVTTSSYEGDEGYLTLVFDITNQENPKILYRVWMPDDISLDNLSEVIR